MIYLLLSIASSTTIFVLFKVFKNYNVNTLQAIVVNYFTAFACGILLYDKPIQIKSIVNADWFLGALFLGFLFISIFNIMALTAQKNGLSVASVASKMSLIIPVIFGIIVFKDSIGVLKIIGVLFALIAVYLTAMKQKDNVNLGNSIYLPILLFFGSGIIDTSINYYGPDGHLPLFSAVIFFIAGIIGIFVLIFKAISNKQYFKLKSLPFGIVLGVVNYASIYFLLKALRIKGLESSTLFTINNVAIVAISTLIGLLIFKEHISKQNWFGIAIALIAIVLVSI